MDLNTLRSIVTLLCFIVFIGIVWWAWSGSNRNRFEQAAMLPFANDDGFADHAQPAPDRAKQ